MQVPILAFHKVDERFEWGLTRLTPRNFQSVMHALYDQGYRTVSLQDALRIRTPIGCKPVAITFDDGYENVLRYAFPQLQSLSYKASLFIITGYIGKTNAWDVNLWGRKFRHLNADQIRMLHQSGWEIGSHTANHADLTRLSQKSLDQELAVSKAILEELTGTAVNFVAFPFGRYNLRVVDAARKAGYMAACGLKKKLYAKGSHESFVLERKAYYLPDGKRNLRAKLESKGHLLENGKLRLVNFFSRGTTWVKPFRPGQCEID